MLIVDFNKNDQVVSDMVYIGFKQQKLKEKNNMAQGLLESSISLIKDSNEATEQVTKTSNILNFIRKVSE